MMKQGFLFSISEAKVFAKAAVHFNEAFETYFVAKDEDSVEYDLIVLCSFESVTNNKFIQVTFSIFALLQ